MKRCLSFLFLGSILLTSCQFGGRYSADLPLDDGSNYHFTSKQLSQEEYFSVIGSLKSPTHDYKYKFTYKKFGDEIRNKTVTGEYISYPISGDYDWGNLITANIGQAFYVASKYFQINGDNSSFSTQTGVWYGTYNRALDYGVYEKRHSNGDEGYREQAYNPNIPTQYPNPTNLKTVKTPQIDYVSMDRISRFGGSGEILKLDGVEGQILDISLSFTDFDYHFEDIPVYSHKLTSKHLVIAEKRKLPSSSSTSPDKNAIYAFCREVESHSNYYFNTKYYYNYKTGDLDKVECSYNTVSTYFEPNMPIVGSYTLEHQNRTLDYVKTENEKYINKFLKFSGVTTYREDYQAV